ALASLEMAAAWGAGAGEGWWRLQAPSAKETAASALSHWARRENVYIWTPDQPILESRQTLPDVPGQVARSGKLAMKALSRRCAAANECRAGLDCTRSGMRRCRIAAAIPGQAFLLVRSNRAA